MAGKVGIRIFVILKNPTEGKKGISAQSPATSFKAHATPRRGSEGGGRRSEGGGRRSEPKDETGFAERNELPCNEPLLDTFPSPLHVVSSRVSIEQIKADIDKLSFEERAELAAWLHGWKDDEWDEQMKRDLAAGKFETVLREVDDDIRIGRLGDMP